MSSVSVIQSAEPRSRADNRPAERGGDVFSEILENTASLRGDRGETPIEGKRKSSPTSVVPSGSTRAEALERSRPAKTSETKKPDGSKTEAHASSERSDETAEEKKLAEPTTGSAEQTDDTEAVPADADRAGTEKPDVETADAAGEAEDSGTDDATESEGVEQPEAPELEAVDADSEPESEADSVGVAALEGHSKTDQEAADDSAPAGPADDTPEQDATMLAATAATSEPTTKAASAPVDVDGEKASAAPAVNAGNSSQAPRGSEQAPGQQPVHPNPTADAARENTPSFSDGENQQRQSQQPHHPQQQNSAQAQDVKPAASLQPRAAEAAPSAAPQIESSSTVQADPSASALALQPARPGAANANPASFQPAVAIDANPVPLTPNAIAVEIVSRMRDGQRRFDIRLDPPDLGRIEVRLDVDRHGNVSTRLTVDRPETLDLMQRDARSLERALQQAGLKTDDAGLQFSLRQHADNHGRDGHGASGRPSELAVSDETEIPGTIIESYRASILARGGVDIRV